jgi:hypothetical protein
MLTLPDFWQIKLKKHLVTLFTCLSRQAPTRLEVVKNGGDSY